MDLCLRVIIKSCLICHVFYETLFYIFFVYGWLFVFMSCIMMSCCCQAIQVNCQMWATSKLPNVSIHLRPICRGFGKSYLFALVSCVSFSFTECVCGRTSLREDCFEKIPKQAQARVKVTDLLHYQYTAFHNLT